VVDFVAAGSCIDSKQSPVVITDFRCNRARKRPVGRQQAGWQALQQRAPAAAASLGGQAGRELRDCGVREGEGGGRPERQWIHSGLRQLARADS
jgi:hypothetical protein